MVNFTLFFSLWQVCKLSFIDSNVTKYIHADIHVSKKGLIFYLFIGTHTSGRCMSRITTTLYHSLRNMRTYAPGIVATINAWSRNQPQSVWYKIQFEIFCGWYLFVFNAQWIHYFKSYNCNFTFILFKNNILKYVLIMFFEIIFFIKNLFSSKML